MVLEGLDGSGKSIVARILFERLVDQECLIHIIHDKSTENIKQFNERRNHVN
jgi:thymidylate kinase